MQLDARVVQHLYMRIFMRKRNYALLHIIGQGEFCLIFGKRAFLLVTYKIKGWKIWI